MESLPTFYNGIHFRSRLEVRWAYLFDVLKIRYAYELQTFQIEEGLLYLPDFWIPTRNIWIEIEPDFPNELEEKKAVGLHQVNSQSMFIFSGFPELVSAVKQANEFLSGLPSANEIIEKGWGDISQQAS